MPAAESLSKKAFQLFTDWMVQASAAESSPALGLKDYDVVVKDLSQAIADAVVKLKTTEKAAKRRKPGYDYGFFCGFIQGNLNVKWHHEYVYKKGNDFKTFTALVSLINFLENNELAQLELADLYRLHYENAVNFEHTAEASRLNLPGQSHTAESANLSGSVLVALDLIRIEIAHKILLCEVRDHLTTVSDYFSEQEVADIIFSGSNSNGR